MVPLGLFMDRKYVSGTDRSKNKIDKNTFFLVIFTKSAQNDQIGFGFGSTTRATTVRKIHITQNVISKYRK